MAAVILVSFGMGVVNQQRSDIHTFTELSASGADLAKRVGCGVCGVREDFVAVCWDVKDRLVERGPRMKR